MKNKPIKKIEKIIPPYLGEHPSMVSLAYLFQLQEKLNELIEVVNSLNQ